MVFECVKCHKDHPMNGGEWHRHYKDDFLVEFVDTFVCASCSESEEENGNHLR